MWIEKVTKAIEFAKKRKPNVYNWNDTFKKHTVVAFGLGKFFEDTHERLFGMCNVAYVSDNDEEKWKHVYYGKECIEPEKIKELENPFVIAVVGNYIPLREQMRAMNIPIMHIYDLYFSNYEKGENVEWLEKELPNIKKAIELLADDQSRDVFTNIFCNKIYGSGTEIDYETFATSGEYFNTGILTIEDNEVFIDAGAYIGDTVDDFVKISNGEFKKIYTLELSTENYKILTNNISQYEKQIHDKIVPINAGVWNQSGQMGYDHFGAMDGCQIIEGKCENLARMVSLDEEIPADETVTFIKMDIEGAEQKALDGAKRIISTDKPKLAICLYHKPEDLWQIPLMIKDYYSSYDVYIRHHSTQNYTDTICYAKCNGGGESCFV